MSAPHFRTLAIVGAEMLDWLHLFPDGATLNDFRLHAKGKLSRYDLDLLGYDRMVLDMLALAGSVSIETIPQEPTRIKITEEDKSR